MKLKRSVAVIMLLIFTCLLLPFTASAAKNSGKTASIMFTHDVHSHFDEFTAVKNGENVYYGGLSVLKTLVDNQEEKDPDTFIFDAGDFSMGTLLQSLYETDATELSMLGYLGTDVTTLGNHEYDYGTDGLVNMLSAAKSSGNTVPQIVISNIDWEKMEKDGLTDEQEELKSAFKAYGVKDYTIIEKGGVKIAVFGIFGTDALSCSPTCALEFKDASEAAKDVISEIKEDGKSYDMLVCVSHGGTNAENEKKSEDEILAENVPEIDLIISGHTHTELSKPIVHGTTYIVSEGEYGENIGSLTMTQSTDGSWNMDTYKLIPTTTNVAENAEAKKIVADYNAKVNKEYLSQFGYTSDQILAENNIVFDTTDVLYTANEEHNLTDLISDAYMYAVEKAEGKDGRNVDITVAPSGTIRETYPVGTLTVSDIFTSFSLGKGTDSVVGYPLISVYLTGSEIKTMAEVDASVSDLMTSARLYTSGLSMTHNTKRMILNKNISCQLIDEDGNLAELDNDKLYRVVTDLYSGRMLGAVSSMSYGLLSIEPKDENGVPYESIDDAIIHVDGKEIKAWVAIAEYMTSFDDTDSDGISNVSQYYASEDHDRKIIISDGSFKALFSNPSKYAVMIVSAVVIFILLIVLIVVIIVKLVKKHKAKKANKQIKE